MTAQQTQNERLAIVETNIKNIGSTVNRIEDMLVKHIEREDLLITKADAEKRYASKEYESKYEKLSTNINGITITAFGGLLLIIGFFIKEIFFK
jgi:hypothetical protein